MKKTLLRAAILLLLACFFQPASTHAQGTAFTYQGQLTAGGAPANGSYDFAFKLHAVDGSGTTTEVTVTNPAVTVTNGLFTTALDFGTLFIGRTSSLQIAVSTNGANLFSTLSPIQTVTPAPYAIYAEAANAAGLSGTVPATQLPSVVVTNNATGLNLSGTFTGNGANLTALNAAQLTGSVADALLSPNVALRAGGNTFTNNQTVYGSFRLDAPGGYSQSSQGNFQIDAPDIFGGRVCVLTNGNVGIGITTPGVKLQVAGTIQATALVGDGGSLTNVTAATLAIPPGMALIPAGTFTMGDSLDGEPDATPTTNITLSAFYMDINLVSYAQWQSVFFWATNHGYGIVNVGAGKAANHPVQTVNWFDCVKWSNARSVQAGLTPVYYTDAGYAQVYTNGQLTPYMNMAANGFRLPTEAEWEKAARGGLSGQRFPWGNIITENLANYAGDTAKASYDLGPNGFNAAFTNGVTPYTSPVGYFAPNGYGLYDMADNVIEWCWDWYGTPYGQPGNTNPTGPATGSNRVQRSGAWEFTPGLGTCAARDDAPPANTSNVVGFRCVRGH